MSTTYETLTLRGEPLRTQSLVSTEATNNPSYKAADAVSFYLQAVPEGVWENSVTLRSTCWARMYQPGQWVDKVSPKPMIWRCWPISARWSPSALS